MSGHVARPYQAEAVNAVLSAWEHHQSVLVVLPTGTGKSFIFSDLVRQNAPAPGARSSWPIGGSCSFRPHGTFSAPVWRHQSRRPSCKPEPDSGTRSRWWWHPFRPSSPKMAWSAGCTSSIRKNSVLLSATRHTCFWPRHSVQSLTISNMEIQKSKSSAVRRRPQGRTKSPSVKSSSTARTDTKFPTRLVMGGSFQFSHLGFVLKGLISLTSRTTAGDLNGADLARVMEAEKPLIWNCARDA